MLGYYDPDCQQQQKQLEELRALYKSYLADYRKEDEKEEKEKEKENGTDPLSLTTANATAKSNETTKIIINNTNGIIKPFN